MGNRISRRSFLAGSAVLGAAAMGGVLAGCSSQDAGSASVDERTWDQEADVVVIGTGFAGLAAAHEASAAGSSVIVVEKAPEEDAGGNSRVCAQAIWSPQKTQEAIAYFKEITTDYHLSNIDDGTIEAYVSGAAENAGWLLDEFDIEAKEYNACEYPAAQTAEAVGEANTIIPGEGLGYSRVWTPIYEVVTSDQNVTFLFETAFTDLIFNDGGEAIGIMVSQNGGELSIKAKKGVVMALGGFEFDETLKANYNRYPAMAWGTPYNTGDGIRACMKYDIDFWHMNSATPATRMGCVAPWMDKRFEGCPIDCDVTGDSGYIWLDKYGKRFTDETRAYQHGYGRDAVFYNDSAKMEWPRLPLWQVVDETTIPFMGTKSSGWHAVVGGYSAVDNHEDLLKAGTLLKADSVEDLASQMGVDAAVLQSSIDEYNAYAALAQPSDSEGSDAKTHALTASVDAHTASGDVDEFGRPIGKMRALAGTLYAIQLYPVMVNTNGGPKRDGNANILRTDGSPVPRLYSAGEFGSVWAWYYQGAGNVSECMVFGRIAGRNAAALTPWDAEA